MLAALEYFDMGAAKQQAIEDMHADVLRDVMGTLGVDLQKMLVEDGIESVVSVVPRAEQAAWVAAHTANTTAPQADGNQGGPTDLELRSSI